MLMTKICIADYSNQTVSGMQALTKGGEELQSFLQAHPDMRAAIPVLLDSLRQMQ